MKPSLDANQNKVEKAEEDTKTYYNRLEADEALDALFDIYWDYEGKISNSQDVVNLLKYYFYNNEILKIKWEQRNLEEKD
jgi:hypothetical protein